MSLGVGMATAMDTLCSQSNGAGTPIKIGVYLQRGMLLYSVGGGQSSLVIMLFSGLIVLTGVTMISCLLIWNAGELLVMAGQDPVVSRMSGDYCRVLLPGLPLFFLYEMVKKCLQSQVMIVFTSTY